MQPDFRTLCWYAVRGQVNFGKGWDYEIEIADADGNEWDVYVDAKSGEVRKISREWF